MRDQAQVASAADGADAAEHDSAILRQFVTFAVADELFAVPMAPVQEIIRVPDTARLPLAPGALEGLANLRGRVLPIVSLRRLLGCEDRAADDATRAVVIDLGQPLGFVVDRVASVISVDDAEIHAADGIQSLLAAEYLTGTIRRTGPDGQPMLVMIVDFGSLVRAHFDAVARAVADGGLGAGTGLHDEDDGLSAGGLAADELRLVSFSVAGQEYALDIGDVQEIVQMPERVAVLPGTPAHVVGVMTLRERLLTLVSLRALFGLPACEASAQQRIVVASLPGGLDVGLLTDAVKEVMSVPRALADPMPGLLAADPAMGEFTAICRLENGRRLVSVVATDRLLTVPGLREAIVAGAGLDPTHDDDTTNDEETMSLDADDDIQLVIFRLGNEEFGVPITGVQEIVRVPETLTRVPRTPDFVEGVINLRGTVLPVVDQRVRLGMAPIARSESQRIMVYLLGGLRTGFIVDAVTEVLRVPQARISPSPRLSAEQSRLIGRVANLDQGRRLVMLVEPERFLEGTELGAVAGMLGTEGATDPQAAHGAATGTGGSGAGPVPAAASAGVPAADAAVAA